MGVVIATGATWTLDQLLSLRKFFGTASDEWLEDHIGQDANSINAKARELALAKDKAQPHEGTVRMPRWTAHQVAVLRNVYPFEPNVAIAHMIGRSVKSVVSKAHAIGLGKHRSRLRAMGRANVKLRRDWLDK